jgi:carboxyl-terminal processing protease
MAALAISSVNAFATEVLSEAQIWKKTKLDSALTSRFINNQVCTSSEIYLESCHKAIAAAQALANGPIADHQNDFEAALKEIEQHLPSEVPVQMMRARAINAHLETFDPYAAIKATEEFRNTQLQSSKKYVGIGMAVEQAPEGVMIRETYPTSPANRAGLRKGDLIVAIAADGRNFEDALHLNVDLLADKIVGENGEPLSIRIRRAGREIEYTNIKRAAVDVVYVNSEMLDKSTGYIRIRSFESITILAQFKKQIRELRSRGMKKLVLDLRGNRGGDKSVAIQIAELFLGPKNLTGTKLLDDSVPSIPAAMNREPETYEKDIQWEPGFTARATYTFPLVVLIDSQSASASEILAGALQDYGRAWLVGETSYGKGSAQSMEQIPGYPSLTLKWTSERFYLPSGRSNQAIGIRPSFEIPRDRDDGDRMVPRLREVDNMPNALSPESQPWVETRPKEKAAITDCVAAHGVPETIDDYEKAYATAVLACSK